MGYFERYEAWINSGLLDASSMQELKSIAGNDKEIEERFYRELEFGTAGLRGILGVGENRMNIYVVERATAGLCSYLLAIDGAKERGVAIGYDSRNFSKEFAAAAARVLTGHGIKTYLFESLRAVPQLSFTLRHLNCIAGIVITASHNPSKYNGYKVYWEDGGQIGPDQANAVTAAIEKTPWFSAKSMDEKSAIDAGLLTMIGKEVDEVYYEKTMSLLLYPELVKEKGHTLKIVYTPLFGAGSVPVQTILSRIGVTNVTVVEEQAMPNGDFPGLSAPNPENPEAFNLARELAKSSGAQVILATDPDSDRLGIAVADESGEFTVLTGNQIGCLLLYHILCAYEKRGNLPKDALVVKSIVSTTLADSICRAFGIEIEDVLTGFRFISEKIDNAVTKGDRTFLFGFEESYGFLAGTFARDKDAICAAMLAAEMCLAYNDRGMTLVEGLNEIYERFGYFGEQVSSYTLQGKEGMESIASTMSAMIENPPASVASYPVESIEDFTKGVRIANGQTEKLTLPTSNMLRLLFANGTWACIRPSGTEPKLKLYVGANAPTAAALKDKLAAIHGELESKLRELLGI